MMRTQIQLSQEQHRRLRRYARRLGVSVSEAVRGCIEDRLAREEGAPSREEQVRAALAVCGKYADPNGRTRVAADHDRVLAEAYSD